MGSCSINIGESMYIEGGAGTGPVGVKAAGNSAPQSIVIVSIG